MSRQRLMYSHGRRFCLATGVLVFLLSWFVLVPKTQAQTVTNSGGDSLQSGNGAGTGSISGGTAGSGTTGSTIGGTGTGGKTSNGIGGSGTGTGTGGKTSNGTGGTGTGGTGTGTGGTGSGSGGTGGGGKAAGGAGSGSGGNGSGNGGSSGQSQQDPLEMLFEDFQALVSDSLGESAPQWEVEIIAAIFFLEFLEEFYPQILELQMYQQAGGSGSGNQAGSSSILNQLGGLGILGGMGSSGQGGGGSGLRTGSQRQRRAAPARQRRHMTPYGF